MATGDHQKEEDEIIVLADVSGSMGDADAGSERRVTRISLLKKALEDLPPGVRKIAFSDDPREVKSVSELHPDGSTNLARAINLAATFKPVRTVIISDGEPDSEPLAVEAAAKLTGIIDVVYCGSPTNKHAREFLESLARAGMGGYYETGDKLEIEKQLPAVIKGLLSK
jgi:Mg-chelatase subunit ChlD